MILVLTTLVSSQGADKPMQRLTLVRAFTCGGGLVGWVLDLELKGDSDASLRLTAGNVVPLSKTLYPLLSTGSTQEGRKHPDTTEKLLTWM